jgi:TPR repeat protein
MTDIVIAAAPADAARASAIAEALAALGFDVAARPPSEADVAKAVEDAKCVLALWSPSAAATPWLAAQAMLALDRNKLVCAELSEGMLPALFEKAPRTNLSSTDRIVFKQRFETLVSQIEKLSPRQSINDALPLALAKARAGLGIVVPRVSRRPPPWTLVGAVAAAMVVLFGIGLGASRLLGQLRSHSILEVQATGARAPAPDAVRAPLYGLSRTELETLPWREAAAKIAPSQAERIKADANNGDAFAQTVACLGHMAGAQGFLPSPTTASVYCDAASAQGFPAALYLSWSLSSMANASITSAVARERLQAAAQHGLVAAQVDYALELAPDAHAPTAAQIEAGRLWLAAADHGDARAQYYYARWLRDSPAGPHDPSMAIPYLQRAADAGEVDALHLLGTFYRDGTGVTRDESRARALYERAAAQNFAPSMLNLADMLRGEDNERAVGLYSQLACMRDQLQIAPLAARRLRAMARAAHCG